MVQAHPAKHAQTPAAGPRTPRRSTVESGPRRSRCCCGWSGRSPCGRDSTVDGASAPANDGASRARPSYSTAASRRARWRRRWLRRPCVKGSGEERSRSGATRAGVPVCRASSNRRTGQALRERAVKPRTRFSTRSAAADTRPMTTAQSVTGPRSSRELGQASHGHSDARRHCRG